MLGFVLDFGFSVFESLQLAKINVLQAIILHILRERRHSNQK